MVSHFLAFISKPPHRGRYGKQKFNIMCKGFRMPTVYAVKSKRVHEEFVYLTLQNINDKNDEFIVRMRKDAKPEKVKHLIQQPDHSNIYYVYLFEIVDDNFIETDRITLTAIPEKKQIDWTNEAEIPEYLQHLYDYEECDCNCKNDKHQ